MPDVFVAPEEEETPTPKTHRPVAVDTKTAQHHPKKSISLLTNFCEYPKGVRFEHQEKDEVVLLFVRRHLITNVPWILVVLTLIFFPLLVMPLFNSALGFDLSIPFNITIVLLAFYYLIVAGYALINIATWFYNIGIVTQKHVVDIDYSDISYKNVATTKVGLVQEVNYTQRGFLRSHFDYGDVFIQTAGNNPNFEFLRVPMPGKVVYIIQKLIGVV